ncbi:alpha/beta hydrolase [Eisenibacter elegans]|jgi:pimeloyl-ACP methyl ester carboxylesterase|uniref:alpha/beta hydrolase n=1 Tax=Eisenibacter elegans TaxID=997 RepID=UPI0003FF456C|nr:alpha/beta hydrolase [Eisenibacter elegans]
MTFKRLLLVFVILFSCLSVGYLMGPKPPKPDITVQLPAQPSDFDALEEQIAAHEAQYNLKPDNEARIVWADSTRRKTPYSIVYLHGFSASQGEGHPVHRRLAAQLGCNLYLARLAGHGQGDKDAMKQLTPEQLIASAAEALAIGQQLGEKVILVGTSTGGALALHLAAQTPEAVAALVLYSPLVVFRKPYIHLLNNPWGRQIGTMAQGEYIQNNGTGKIAQYWSQHYHLQGVIALTSFAEAVMTEETFSKVTQPCFMGYYYKDEENQDQTVSVEAALQMFEMLATPKSQKRAQAFPDAGAHVIASQYTNPQYKKVQEATVKFLEEVVFK